MKTDILFTTWNCEECALIKQKTNPDALFEDDFIGKEEQHLSLIQTFSNTATQVLFEHYNFSSDLITPVVCTHNGKIITEVEDILNYFKDQGFLNAKET